MKFANAFLAVVATVALVISLRPASGPKYTEGPFEAYQPIQVIDVVDGGPLPFTVDSLGTMVSGDGNSR